MTEEVLGMIIKHRDQLLSLRIINLSYNQVNDRKAKTKIDTLKKMGVIVNLWSFIVVDHHVIAVESWFVWISQ